MTEQPQNQAKHDIGEDFDTEATQAAQQILEGTKPVKTDVEIADQVGRITWKLADRVQRLDSEKRSNDKPASVTRSAQLPDGGKVWARLYLGGRDVVHRTADGKVHHAGAGWKHGNGGPVERHTDVQTDSPGKKMNTRDKSELMAGKPKLIMGITDDPREWNDMFEPATEEVRSQAIANAAETLGTIRGAVAQAENAQRAEQAPHEPQQPLQG